MGELQLLIWCWLVGCDRSPCCCRRTRSSWSQDPSMLLTLTTPSVTGSCTVLLGVSRPRHLQGTLLMSPVVPAKSTRGRAWDLPLCFCYRNVIRSTEHCGLSRRNRLYREEEKKRFTVPQTDLNEICFKKTLAFLRDETCLSFKLLDVIFSI